MIDEQRLSANLAADVDEHFEQFVRTYQDRIYGFTLRLTGNAQDAEECAQDAFVRAYRALHGYPPERRRELRLRAWLYQIALNVVRNRVRRATLRVVPFDGVMQDTLRASPDEQPEVASLRAESRKNLDTLLRQLPERYATAVTLRHVHGLSYAEAAEILEQPLGTTKSDVHRGLRLLREALEPELLLEARSN
jgi:RNA polymerase sigma-70 factor (ECF subfamily)